METRRGINRIALLGNLGNDPELHYTESGHPVASASMAVLEECTSANGDTMIGLQWFRLVGFGGCAEALTAEGVVSGLRVWCEGRLQTRPYADHHGTIRTAIEVVLSDFQVIA